MDNLLILLILENGRKSEEIEGNVSKEVTSTTYKYRNADKRREYMREYMKRRRNEKK